MPSLPLIKIRQVLTAAIGEIINEKRGGRGAGEGENRGRFRQEATKGRVRYAPGPWYNESMLSRESVTHTPDILNIVPLWRHQLFPQCLNT